MKGLLLLASLAMQDPATPPATPAPENPLANVHFITGQATIGSLATIALPDGYEFLAQKDARYVLEQLLGNPPDATRQGLIVKGGADGLMDDSWFVVVRYEPDGYVNDDDAAKLDFDELLDSMKDEAKEGNAERKQGGYPEVELLGWAEPPHYDASTKKLYWARRLQFSGTDGETLNYDVRILGRKGVLVYTAVARVDELATVADGSKQLLAGTDFTNGNRHEDFNPSVDKIAAYGIGGLIAGKVLLKVGLLAKFGVLFAKGWKLVLIAFVAIGAFLKKIFGRAPVSETQNPTA